MTGEPQARLLRTWRFKIFTSTWLAYAGLYFCRKPFFVAKSTLGDELAFDPMTLGYIGVVYHVAYFLGQFISARLGMVTGARLLLLVGIAASIAANVVFGFADNLYTFMVFMGVNGLAQATGWPSTVGTLGQWTERHERGTLMGFWSTCYQLGSIAASAWAALWLAQIGWRGAFFGGTTVLLVVWGYIWFFLRNRPQDAGLPAYPDDEEVERGEGETTSVWTAQLITTVMLVGAFYFFVKFVRYAIWSWAPLFIDRNFDMTGAEGGALAEVFTAGGFIGVIVAGYVSDRYFEARRARLSFYMLVGMTLGCGLLYWVGVHNVWLFLGSLALVGFMLFGPDSLMTGAGAIDVGSRRAALTAAGLINGVGAAGQVLQETVVPLVYQRYDNQVGPVMALLFGASALGMAALGLVLWRNRKGLADL